MDRRKFLQGMALTAAGLYIPTKTFFLPPKGGWPTGPIWEGVPLDLWLKRGNIDVKHAIIYADAKKNGNDLIYDAKDYCETMLAHLEFDAIEISNPANLGPERLTVHKENLTIREGDSLTIQWHPSGILTLEDTEAGFMPSIPGSRAAS